MTDRRLLLALVAAAACTPTPAPLTDGALPDADVPITGIPDALPGTPDADPTPASLAFTIGDGGFGDVVIGADATHGFTIANSGDQASAALTINVTAPFVLADDACADGVAGHASCDFAIVFRPEVSGQAAAMLAVATPTGAVPGLTRSLTGRGLEAAALSVVPASAVDFGMIELGKASSAQQFRINNDGDQDSAALAIVVDDPAAFALRNDTCAGHPVTGRSSCTFELVFAPTAQGAASSAVHVTGGGAAIDRAVSGQGLEIGNLQLQESAHAFGPLAIDGGARTTTLHLANIGQVAVDVPTPSLSGAGAPAYTVDASACPASLAAAAGCTIDVSFDPATVGGQPASISLANASGTTSTSLGGTGVAHVKVVRTGTGAGTIGFSQNGLVCGGAPSVCEGDFASTPLTLTGEPDATSLVGGWTGCDHPSGGTCMLDLTGARQVGAAFTRRSYTVTVHVAGTGAGAITVGGASLACANGTCTGTFVAGPLTVAAVPDATSTFDGWTAPCGAAGSCALDLSSDLDLTATFTRKSYTVTVTRAGAGSGAIAVNGNALTCTNTICTGTFVATPALAVVAAPDASSTFAGWSAPCGASTTCTTALASDLALTATFVPKQYTLTVSLAGGTGAVTANGNPLACSATMCTGTFSAHTALTLAVTATAGSTFSGWSTCAGTGTCAVTLDADTAVVATFVPVMPSVSVAIASGAGTSTVTGSGIACPGTCTTKVAYNSGLTLTANPATGYRFVAWTGCASTSGATCTLAAITTDRSVTAAFELIVPTVDVTISGGAGVGTVTGAGINCPSGCSTTVAYNSNLTLTASPATGYQLLMWTGCSSTSGATCTLSAITDDRPVTAIFATLNPNVQVTIAGVAGASTVTGGSINCPGACSVAVAYNATLTLTANPATGYRFVDWAGCSSVSGTTCTLTGITSGKSVFATFAAITPTVTVTIAGTAGGSTVTGAGIDCPSGCATAVSYNSNLTLTANPAASYQLVGWTGCAASTGNTCTLSAITSDKPVTATFAHVDPTVSVTIAGTAGTSTVTGAGINCPGACATSVAYNGNLALTANPATGYQLVSWSGCASTSGNTCALSSITAAKAVTATFVAITPAVDVTIAGPTGAGTVAGGAIDCPGTCATSVTYNSNLTLTASPATGYQLASWAGCASMSGNTCTLSSITTAKSVTATFVAITPAVDVAITGPTGAGTVTALGINCPGACSTQVAYNSSLTLTANPATGYQLASWSGCASTSGNTCTLTAITADRPVTATFTVITPTVDVVISGATGAGTVTATGITCPGTCATTVAYNGSLTLTASPAAGYQLMSWSGCTSTSGSTCTLSSITSGKTVTASFIPYTPTIDVTIAGTAGTSTVTGGVITCPGTCSTTVTYNNNFTLSANPAAGYQLKSWTGCTSASGNTCTLLQVKTAKSITATFEKIVPTVDVTIAGTAGTSAVTATGIACPSDCTTTVTYNTNLTLTANPATGYSFVSWSGCSSTSSTTCTLSAIKTDKAVTATFAPNNPPVTVTIAGTPGTSTVTGGSINCPGTCTTNVAYNANLTLTANPVAGYVLSSWSGCSSTNGNTCTLTGITSMKAVTATFAASTPPVTVAIAGAPGTSTVTGGSINCPGTCTANVTYNSSLTLTANPVAGRILSSWSGCSSTNGNTCTLSSITAAKSVTATFAAYAPPVSVTIAGTPGGSTVTGGSISCPGTCATTVTYNTNLTLTANPVAGYTLTSWNGCSSTSGNTCTLSSITAAKSVTATFSAITPVISVSLGGTAGSSTVTSTNPTGISCPGACAATLGYGGGITLTANPAVGYRFIGWSGGGCTGASACTLTNVTASAATVATFGPTYSLGVQGLGDGTGTFSGAIPCGAGLSCGATGYAPGSYTVTAEPSAGMLWGGWANGTPCAGQGQSCTFTLSSNTSLSAYFYRSTYTLTLGAHIRCTTNCYPSTAYPRNSTVALQGGYTTITGPVTNRMLCIYNVQDWNNCTVDAVDPNVCYVMMSTDQSVSATFYLESCEPLDPP